MRLRRITIILLAVIAVGASLWLLNRNKAIEPTAVADKALAPDFNLPQLDGRPLRLSDYRGKVVLLDFWASWCAPCREEVPRFVEWKTKYENQGLQIIGLSMDDSAKAASDFSREMKVNYPVALADDDVVRRYGGVLGLPVNIVIGRDGSIKARHLGFTDLSLLESELRSQLDAQW